MNDWFRYSFLMAAAILLTGCSHDAGDELGGGGIITPPQPETAIVFTGDMLEEKTVTRADALEEYYTSFNVWGYKNNTYASNSYTDYETVMYGYTVNYTSGSDNSSTSNSNGWEYVDQQTEGATKQSIKYWDPDAKAYRFFGCTGTIGTDVTVTEDMTSDPKSVTLACEVNAAREQTLLYSKLWFSTGSQDYPDKQFGKAVKLEFQKPVVKVRFLYKLSDETGMFLLEDQNFAPTTEGKTIATAGIFNVTYPLTGTATAETWSVGTTTASIEGFTEDYYEIGENEDVAESILAGQKKWYTVLPATNQGPYELSVKINEEPRSAIVPAEYMEWKPGYQYTYVFKITDSGSVTLEDVFSGFIKWDSEEASYTIYNW